MAYIPFKVIYCACIHVIFAFTETTTAVPATHCPERELRCAMNMIQDREERYLRYRFGFDDDIEHPLTETAKHFHLSESRARSSSRKSIETLNTRAMRMMFSLPNLSVSPRRNRLSVLSAVPIRTASSACVIFVDFIKSFMRSRIVPGKKT